MSNLPTLSIVIPVYNAAGFLTECLDSILKQDTNNVEIILIDDGSTDESGIICDDFSNKYQSVITTHQKNLGVSYARNIGIERSSGQWISFVDPDDYVSNNYISTFRELAQDTDLTFFSLAIKTSDGRVKQKIMRDAAFNGRQEMQNGIFEMMFNDQNCEFFGFTVNKFFRSDIIHEYNVRFTPNLTFREDELFTLDYCRHISHFTTSSATLYVYRIDVQGSLSHTKKSFDDLCTYYDHALVRFDDFTDTPLKSAEYTRLLDLLINAYSPQMDREQFSKLLDRLSFLIKYRANYLQHLKKLYVFKILVSLPTIFAIPPLRFILHIIFLRNQTNLKKTPTRDPLW